MSYADARSLLSGEVDFTMMYASHDAFARDLRRLTTACDKNAGVTPEVKAGWAAFKRQLHVHHTSEDVALWPALRAAVLHPYEAAVLDDMEREHAMLDPYLERIDLAFAAQDTAALGEAATVLAAGLSAHMGHEETDALPLVETYLGRKGWAAFTGHIRSVQGFSGAAEFLPWLLDHAPTATRNQVLQALPPPARLLYRSVWAPRYHRTPRWSP